MGGGSHTPTHQSHQSHSQSHHPGRQCSYWVAHCDKSGRFSYEAENQFSEFKSHHLQMGFYISPVEGGENEWKFGPHTSD